MPCFLIVLQRIFRNLNRIDHGLYSIQHVTRRNLVLVGRELLQFASRFGEIIETDGSARSFQPMRQIAQLREILVSQRLFHRGGLLNQTFGELANRRVEPRMTGQARHHRRLERPEGIPVKLSHLATD